MADDYPNIIDNTGVLLRHLNVEELKSAWSANTSGVFNRPLASLSFALNYYFAGQYFQPLAFKLTNIAIHILNSFLVFFLSRLLFTIAAPRYPAQKLAFLAALIWALHPLQLTSVLYVVQRMTSMSCLFMLSGCLLFLKGRLQVEKPFGMVLMWAGCIFGVLFGTLTKENALLLPLLIFVIEITLLPTIQAGAVRNRLCAYYGVTVMLPVLLGIAYLLTHPAYFSIAYQSRDFSMAERAMTEARILFYYLGLLLYPDNTQLGIFHDDFTLSMGLFQPIATLISIVGIVVLIAVAVVNCLRKKMPFLNFGILWFFVGHVMESSIFPLELIYEHRNYVPSIGIAMSVVAVLYELLSKRINTSLLNVLYASVVISLGLATHTRSAIWSSLDSLSYFEVRNHPDSTRANGTYANSLEMKRGPNVETYQHYLIASQLNVFEVSALIEVFNELNKLIHFHDPAKDENTVVMPSHYDDPLVLNSRYMQALRELVHQEIVRRISAKSYPLRTLVALRSAANCLINNNYECRDNGANLMEWIDTALERPDFFDVAMIHLIKAKVCFNQGNSEEALLNVNKAIELSPNRMYFYAEKAYLLIMLNELDDAEQVIRQAEARGVANGFDAQEFKNLREMIVAKQTVVTR